MGHGIGQASGFGVIHAHQALQFGEFADHGAAQIGFGNGGGLVGHVSIRTYQGGDVARQRRDAGDAVGLGAEFVMEGHRFQPVKPFAHPRLCHAQVILPEKARI